VGRKRRQTPRAVIEIAQFRDGRELACHDRVELTAGEGDPGVLPRIDPAPQLVPPAGQHPRRLPDEAASEAMAHVYPVRGHPQPWTPYGRPPSGSSTRSEARFRPRWPASKTTSMRC
jgi:hypothetical protein